MKRQFILKVLLVVVMASLIGCGGGGGGSSAPAPAPEIAKTTVTGKVEFPALSSLVAKQVSLDAGPLTFVQAYTIDGKPIGTQATADNDGNFSIQGLSSGVDYVLKATRGLQILKKLIEKSAVAPGVTLPAQDLSSFSTTAVAVASQKLASSAGVASLSLGEPMTLTDTQKSAVSTKIFTDVSPKALETAISTAAGTVQAAITSGDLSTLTAAVADLVNTLNIIVAAVSTNTDPTKVLSGQVANFNISTEEPKQLRLINVDNTGAVTQGSALSTVTSTHILSAVTSSVDTYVPPARVKLDISTDVAASTLYGITLDITIPVDAHVKLAAGNTPDMAMISLAPGVPASTFLVANMLTATTLRIVIAAESPLPTGNLLSIVFDRTESKPVVSSAFSIITSPYDANGAKLTSSFILTKTATSSGI